MLEIFSEHIQNLHDQTVLTILILALHVYPEASNRRLKLQKTILEGSGARELLGTRFCIFK
jgi:hypothetical protein